MVSPFTLTLTAPHAQLPSSLLPAVLACWDILVQQNTLDDEGVLVWNREVSNREVEWVRGQENAAG
jgi:hypothetical protein